MKDFYDLGINPVAVQLGNEVCIEDLILVTVLYACILTCLIET